MANRKHEIEERVRARNLSEPAGNRPRVESFMKSQKIHVIHVLGGFGYGGVETWLLNVLRNMNQQDFQVDFVVHSSHLRELDREVLDLGSKIYRLPYQRNLLRYARSLSKVLSLTGPYDAIHSHVHHFSGFLLWLAHRHNIPIRIAHSHADTRRTYATANVARRFYAAQMRRLIDGHATLKLGASDLAARALFGDDWSIDPHTRVLNYGVDIKSFDVKVDHDRIRSALKLPGGSLIVGHVGRFDRQKNHEFLIEITVHLVRLEPSARVVLVGDGPLRSTIQSRVSDLRLEESVSFLGKRDDVRELMLGGMDALVMPSLWEGLPLAGIEAQAAGLPLIISNRVSPEINAVGGAVHMIPLEAGAEKWAAVILAAAKETRSSGKSRKAQEGGSFDIATVVSELENIYSGTRPGICQSAPRKCSRAASRL